MNGILEPRDEEKVVKRKKKRYRRFREYEEIAERTSLFKELLIEVNALQDIRNGVAHGDGKFFSDPGTVLKTILSAQSVFKKKRTDAKFSKPLMLVDLLKTANLPSKLDNFVSHFPDIPVEWKSIYTELIITFVQEDEDENENAPEDEDSSENRLNLATIERFLKFSFDHLSKSTQIEIWDKFISIALPYLQGNKQTFRTNAQICSLLPIPSGIQRSHTNTYFEAYAEYLIEWLDEDVEYIKRQKALLLSLGRSTDEISNQHAEIGRVITRIKECIPSHLKEQLDSIESIWSESL